MKRSRTMLAAALAAVAVASALVAAGAAPAEARQGPVAHAAVTCDDHPNQASAQRAKDTRDADGDGIYCVIYSG